MEVSAALGYTALVDHTLYCLWQSNLRFFRTGSSLWFCIWKWNQFIL